MARQMKRTQKTSSGTTHTAAEMQEWYENNKHNIENYAIAQDSIHNLRDVTKSISTKTISTIDKSTLKTYIKNISTNEKNLRNTMRYLYYRSNILFRLVNWYADMWDLRCRIVYPNYDLVKGADSTKMIKSYNETLDLLNLMDMQGNMTERLINVYVQDVSYAIAFIDDTGMFFYELDPDECIIDSRYSTKDFGFSVDMSKWKSNTRQQVIEYLGSPLKEMYAEYEKTGVKYIHCPDEYASCFKFRTDTWDTVVPPFLTLAIQLSNIEDLVDIQAEADALSIYKLIYLPMKVLSGTKESDDFEITPDITQKYFNRLIQEDVIPDNVGAAMIPGDELKTIDFSRTADSDTNSVEMAYNQVLMTSGGGAVINANNITSTAAFNAWLKEETEFAISTLLPQVNGFVNRMLMSRLSNPCKVEHFELSVYTRDDFAKSLLESCQYSYANRLAYNTCLGINEKASIAMMHLENEILGLPTLMQYPLASSYTQSGSSDGATDEGGAPTKDAEILTPSGDASRNQ